MKTVFIFSILILGSTTLAFCNSTAVQPLTVNIPSKSSITTSASTALLSVTLNASGEGSAQNTETTYSISSNGKGKRALKITGSLTSGGDMPQNTSLTINLGSSTGTSLGSQILTTQSANLVTSLPILVSDTASITYIFKVTNGWTIPAQTITRTVTLTLTSES